MKICCGLGLPRETKQGGRGATAGGGKIMITSLLVVKGREVPQKQVRSYSWRCDRRQWEREQRHSSWKVRVLCWGLMYLGSVVSVMRFPDVRKPLEDTSKQSTLHLKSVISETKWAYSFDFSVCLSSIFFSAGHVSSSRWMGFAWLFIITMLSHRAQVVLSLRLELCIPANLCWMWIWMLLMKNMAIRTETQT